MIDVYWDSGLEWASYLAMDEDGVWFWYESQPSELGNIWLSADRYVIASHKHPDWRQSLTERPKE